MNVLDLAQELNLSPKRYATTKGGEYKSKCPKCQEGTDRFCIWPHQGESGRYWCRICETKGDGIQFCRDFLGMTFHQACQKLHIPPKLSIIQKISRKEKTFKPHATLPIHQSWQQAAKHFIASSHKRLLTEPKILELLAKRGFNLDSIKRFALGWNPEDLFEDRETWGLPYEVKTSGYPKRQWLPKGIVIPSYSNNEPVKIKIRRSDWHKEDHLPKYIEISGSQQSPSIYGDMSKPVMIVESELDAMLIQQAASDLICSVALGGVSKKPDEELDEWLKHASLILISLDFDDSGKKHCSFWIKQYSNLRPWPIPSFKSPGDAFEKSSINLANWIKCGLSNARL